MSGTQPTVPGSGSGGGENPESVMQDAQGDPALNAMTPAQLAAMLRQFQESLDAQKAELERCKQE